MVPVDLYGPSLICECPPKMPVEAGASTKATSQVSKVAQQSSTIANSLHEVVAGPGTFSMSRRTTRSLVQCFHDRHRRTIERFPSPVTVSVAGWRWAPRPRSHRRTRSVVPLRWRENSALLAFSRVRISPILSGTIVLDQRREHLVENLHGPLRHAALPVWTRGPWHVNFEPKVPS